MGASTGQIEQINSLENGKGLQYFVNEAYKILGNPMILFNMEYRLLACTENIVTDDFLWNELVTTGAFGSESINFFKDAGFQDAAASSTSILLLKNDKLKYDRLYGRVFDSHNSTVADLIMVACHKRLVDEDYLVLSALCEKLTQEICALESFQKYSIIYHESLIHQLLGIGIDDKIIFADHMANLYEGLKTNLFVAVADAGTGNAANGGLADFRDLCKSVQPDCKYAVYSNYLVIIAGTDDMALNINSDLNKLAELFERHDVYMGISARFENLFDLLKHYNQAVEALTQGLANNCHQRIFSYVDNSVE